MPNRTIAIRPPHRYRFRWLPLLLLASVLQVQAAARPVLSTGVPVEALASDDYTGVSPTPEVRLQFGASRWTSVVDRSAMANADAWVQITVEISRDLGGTWAPLCSTRTNGGVLADWDAQPTTLVCDLGTPSTAETVLRSTVEVYQCDSLGAEYACVGKTDAIEALSYDVRVD